MSQPERMEYTHNPTLRRPNNHRLFTRAQACVSDLSQVDDREGPRCASRGGMTPQLEPLHGGWVAVGDGWTAYGRTRGVALQTFRLAKKSRRGRRKSTSVERFFAAIGRRRRLHPRPLSD
jgi:hypothetical protein